MSASGARRSLVIAGSVALLAGLAGAAVPPSRALQTLAPDGRLALSTAQLVDAVPFAVAACGVGLLAAGLSARLRRGFAGAWQEPAAPARTRAVPLVAVACCVLRLVVASFSDAGLGDDGARVVWLERWLREPGPIWSGFWAPGHLYVHALFWCVLRDAVVAGAVLAAVAAGGTAWIVGRRTEAVWGHPAGVLAALFVTLSPVGVAYGSVPDVNPFFAFCIVASVAAARRYGADARARWLVIASIAFAFAAWSRFEAFVLAPAAAASLWPRRRTALGFGFLLLVPPAAWWIADWVATGAAARVVTAVHSDPASGGARASALFSCAAAAVRGVSPVVLLLCAAGIARALRARQGREWILPLVLHAATLAAAAWTSGAGGQARYFLAAGAFASPYAAAAIAGVGRRQRSAGIASGAVALVLHAILPPLVPGVGYAWVCRDPDARDVVDIARELAGDSDVVWIADRGAYFYACRTRIQIERYHALGRADDSPAAVAAALPRAAPVLVCVQETPRPQAQWRALSAARSADVQAIASAGDIRMWRMMPAAP